MTENYFKFLQMVNSKPGPVTMIEYDLCESYLRRFGSEHLAHKLLGQGKSKAEEMESFTIRHILQDRYRRNGPENCCNIL